MTPLFNRVVPSSSVPASLSVVVPPSVFAPVKSQIAALSTATLSNPVKLVPSPPIVPMLAAEASSSVSPPVPH